MSTDSSIQDQTYAFFVIEAPELLQSIEEDLYTLRSDRSLGKVHHLMRMTHTLKGAAASVGLKTIKEIAHSLEDIFKALYHPELEIDVALETLLFRGYEALREPLMAELAGCPVNSEQALSYARTIFTKIHEKFGNQVDPSAPLPSSAELGFDLTESIFETGVQDRITALATVAKAGSWTEVAQALREQSQVFWGLAESLGLPGFGQIAQATLAALNHHPNQTLAIANVAIADFKAARAAVLGGDRSQGGAPSQTLIQWSQAPNHFPAEHREDLGSLWVLGEPGGVEPEPDLATLFVRSDSPEGLEQGVVCEPDPPVLADLFTSISDVLSENASPDPSEPSLADLLTGFAGAPSDHTDPEPPEPLLADLLTGFTDVPSDLLTGFAGAPSVNASPDLTSTGLSPLALGPLHLELGPVIQGLETPFPPTATPVSRLQTNPSQSIRVETVKLKQLERLTGEILTQQNRQFTTNQQLDEITLKLQEQVIAHRQLLQKIRDWGDRLLTRSSGIQVSEKNVPDNLLFARSHDLDSIELDPYGELHVLLQSALEETVQLEEFTEGIQLFSQQRNQGLDKQKRLLNEVRDTLANAQMLPVEILFNRFQPLVQQLSLNYGKVAELHLSGTRLLMDRFLIEKLYDPILHLLRNGFDHGLESSADRQFLGKPEVGKLSLQAYRRDRWFVITISDDGKGIDYDKVLSRAIELQLLKPEDAANLNENQLLACLFEPGFSTVSRLSDLSGRGIGLDVVKNQIEVLQGRITVQSRPYHGTTFSLYLPYEINVAKVVICRVKFHLYAFLSESIEQVVAPSAEQIQVQPSGRYLQLSYSEPDQSIPIQDLGEQLLYATARADNYLTVPDHPRKPLLIFHQGIHRVALEIDEVIGEEEVVIRPVQDLIPLPPLVMGCCVLSDGHLTLLLDGTTFLNQDSDFISISSRKTPTLVEPQVSPLEVGIGGTVLVVDDSVTLRQNLALTLQKAGYRVLQASDGQQALTQLQQYSQIDLVICDVEMPQMNGFEFLSRRSQEAELAKIPVIMLTSRTGEKHRKIALDLGANGYLGKPYLDQELLDAIAPFLATHRHSQVESLFCPTA